MDVDPTFVADGKPSEAVEPGEAALDDPSMPTKLLLGFDAAPGDARLHATTAAGASAPTVVVGLVGVQLVWPAPWPATLACHGRHGIEHRFERHAVVDVGPGQPEAERGAACVGDQMTFCAGPASIRRVRPGFGTPLLAAIDELSTQARLQSMRSASRRRHSSSPCRLSHTPAACQSRNLRQHVTPDPQPNSAGSLSHGMPVRSTNRMPVSAARAGTGGRPPFGLAGMGGSRGSMMDQSDSGTKNAGIHH